MALRLSKGLRNYVNEIGCLKQGLSGGRLLIYTGAQPAAADDAVTGTLLCTFTDASGAHTAEVLATGSVALTGGGSGSVNTLTVNGIEIMGSATSFNASLTQTAADIATKINNNRKNLLFTAANNGSATVTLTARPGLGTLANGWVVASTVTTITKTDTNMASGVDAANGLIFGDSATGILSKPTTQVWSGVAVATGTAGYFRFLGSVADAGALDSSEVFLRLDGNISTSGANMNISNTTITSGATQTIGTGTITEPAS